MKDYALRTFSIKIYQFPILNLINTVSGIGQRPIILQSLILHAQFSIPSVCVLGQFTRKSFSVALVNAV